MVASAALLGLGVYSDEPVWIVTWFALALAPVGATEGPFWITAVELGGRRGGTSAAVCNTGGLIAPVLTPLLGAHLGWPAAMAAGGAACLFGAALWRWIDPEET